MICQGKCTSWSASDIDSNHGMRHKIHVIHHVTMFTVVCVQYDNYNQLCYYQRSKHTHHSLRLLVYDYCLFNTTAIYSSPKLRCKQLRYSKQTCTTSGLRFVFPYLWQMLMTARWQVHTTHSAHRNSLNRSQVQLMTITKYDRLNQSVSQCLTINCMPTRINKHQCTYIYLQRAGACLLKHQASISNIKQLNITFRWFLLICDGDCEQELYWQKRILWSLGLWEMLKVNYYMNKMLFV